jgi:hypothetical protein
MDETALQHLRDRIAEHLDKIAELFKGTPKITIVIRGPWLEAEGTDADVVLSDDDFDLAIAAINRLRNRTPVGG